MSWTGFFSPTRKSGAEESSTTFKVQMMSADRTQNPTKKGVEEGSTTSGLCRWSRRSRYYSMLSIGHIKGLSPRFLRDFFLVVIVMTMTSSSTTSTSSSSTTSSSSSALSLSLSSFSSSSMSSPYHQDLF
eukprot:5112308-Amphidinium_carterae.1